jgi:hypothetical protein
MFARFRTGTCRTVAVIGLLALALGAAGCGKAKPSDQEQIRMTVAALATGTAAKDYKALCSKVLSKALVTKVEAVGLTCERALQRGLGSVKAPRLALKRVRILKDVGLALVDTSAVGEAPATTTLRLVREGGGWRIASLSGAQPPAPAGTAEAP